MKSSSLLIFCTLLAGFFSVSAQQQFISPATQSDEAAHLREQIERIIFSAQKDLEESDTRLRAALQRIKDLESENEQLQTQLDRRSESESLNRRQLARQLERSEETKQRLSVENMLLRKQLESALQNQEQVIADQDQAQKRYSQKDENLNRQQRKAYQELERQFELAGREILRLRAQVGQSQSALGELQAKHQSEVGQLQQNNQVLTLQVNGLITQLQAVQQQTRQVSAGRLSGQQLVDSLRYELSAKERMLEVLNRADRVNRDRIARLEAGERNLEAERSKMDARWQLMLTREQELARLQETIRLKEEKYRNLEAKEKQLKLYEQQLKQQGYSLHNNGSARGQ